jgi:hypothetical protein
MAVPTNVAIASKYAINIADDLPLAIYDILPDPDAMQVPAGGGDAFYDNEVWPAPPHPPVLDETHPISGSRRWVWFDIPSTHTTYNSSAYFLMSRFNGQAEWPTVSGLPMIYGGTNRTRYSLLNRDVSMSEPPLPFLQVPSFGIGQTYEDRARTIEWWMETDPYPHPVNMNMFDDQTAIYSPEMNEGEHYSLVGTGFVLNPGGVTPPNSECNVITLDDTKITFIKDQPVLIAKRVYTFAVTARNDSGQPYMNLTVNLKLTQDRIVGAPMEKVYTDTFQVYSPSGAWETFVIEFVAHEAMMYPTLEVSLETDDLAQITQMGIWAGTGGAWAPPGVDSNSDVEFFTTTRPTEIMTVGGINGSAVTVLADASYLYLRSVDQIDCYYMGEWGRQMYMALVDEGGRYSLFMNTERILSVKKVDTASTGLAGEYIMFYISPQFKYIDMATIAIYPNQLSRDLMKLHYIFGTGPKYVDVMKKIPSENMYIADGSAVDFAGQALFPQSHSFKMGTSYGLNYEQNTLTLPEYQLPPLINATYDDMIFTFSAGNEYSLLYFQVPENAYMSWSPKRDVSDDINYVFIDIASLLADNVPGSDVTKICRIESRESEYVLDFYLDIDLSSSGDFLDSDFNRDFATTEKVGVVKGYMYDGTTQTQVFSQAIVQADFSLCFNIKALQEHENYDIAMMFSDPNFNIVFDNQVKLKSISCSTTENLKVNNLLLPGETDIPDILVDCHYDDFGMDTRGLLQNATYSIYPNVDIVDGDDTIFLDIAANGYWKVNIPLTNLAAFINGKPDLDFVVYSDSERIPQIVAGLNTNRLTYSELQTYILQRTQSWINAGKYSAAQTLFTGMPNMDVGVEVQNIIPTLGRFANPSIQTYVTLDSRSRFPFKRYADLKMKRATMEMFVDFENSPESILDTKWEIMNDFVIRMPKHVNLARYELAYAVHMRTPSMTLQRPMLRRADFFGVASGTSVANSINTGNGGRVYVGNADGQYSTDITYSAHIPTETFPSMYMPKTFGFYPHTIAASENPGNIVYPLTVENSLKVLSFYMLWRGETFPNSELLFPGLVDVVGLIKYKNLLDAQVTNAVNVHTTAALLKQEAKIEFSVPGPTVFVDGVEDGTLYVGKWHLIQINIDEPNTDAVFVQMNSNAVMNFVASSIKDIEPQKLYAARTGSAYILNTDEDIPSITVANGRAVRRDMQLSKNPYSFDL